MSPEHSVRTTVDGRELTVSNLEKVLYPATGFTKGQVIDYYARVADVMLAHVKDRPLTMKRYPNGVDHTYFFEKHVPDHAPSWVHHQAVPSTSRGGPVDHPVVCDRPTLVWAANLAAIELHVPLWHVGRRRVLPAPPDHLVFDLHRGVLPCGPARGGDPRWWPIRLLAQDQRLQGPPALRAAHRPTHLGEDP